MLAYGLCVSSVLLGDASPEQEQSEMSAGGARRSSGSVLRARHVVVELRIHQAPITSPGVGTRLQ